MRESKAFLVAGRGGLYGYKISRIPQEIEDPIQIEQTTKINTLLQATTKHVNMERTVT
jgi:hypothetical protein